MIDVLNILMPSLAFAKNYHLQGIDLSGKKRNPLYFSMDSNRLYYMKSDAKTVMPGDVNFYDKDYVYLYQTENDWIPNTFKQYATSETASGGWRFCPRRVTDVSQALVTNDTTYKVYQGTPDAPQGVTKTATLGQAIMTLDVESPRSIFEVDGSLITTQKALRISYQWANAQSMEQFYYAPPYGWIEWQLWQLESGVYGQKDCVRFNQVVAGGV